jgi:mannuronan synthase
MPPVTGPAGLTRRHAAPRTPRYVPRPTDRVFIDQARHEPSFFEKWTPLVQVKILLYLCCCFAALLLLPNSIYSPELREFTYIIGILGIWRFGWWFNHLARAKIYEKIAYPRMAERAKDVWDSGWRPRHVHIQMTTFREHREISESVIRGLVQQIRECGVPATLWLGSSERADEDKIANHLKIVGSDCDITLRIIRQNQPGKRVAIALILRAMSRHVVPKDDLVVFMDGDFVIHPGNFARCFPLFAIDPGLHALTTNEDVIVKGPWWMGPWLNMRFSQRRLAMQSHALSGRVLTLTGRMSVFRAEHIVKEEFIRLQEADFLHHWLWGTFRFLSGDDKSTWYTLLKYGVRMTYVPDANGTTIEVVDGSGYRRMVENLRRWSGNMLRNGYRAIMLGPTKMPFFIWWCLVDQRLAMWTMLFSPLLAIAGAMKIGWPFLAAYVVYIAITRMILSMVLWTYAREVDINYVWTLYTNQLLNAGVKVYMLWRLSKQRWANRGNQTAGMGGQTLLSRAKDWMAMYLTAISFGALFLSVMLYTELLAIPTWGFVKTMFLGY